MLPREKRLKKKTLKKSLFFILILILTLILCSCSKTEYISYPVYPELPPIIKPESPVLQNCKFNIENKQVIISENEYISCIIINNEIKNKYILSLIKTIDNVDNQRLEWIKLNQSNKKQ